MQQEQREAFISHSLQESLKTFRYVAKNVVKVSLLCGLLELQTHGGKSLQVHGGIVHSTTVTQLLQMEDELVEALKVSGEHNHGQERLEED